MLLEAPHQILRNTIATIWMGGRAPQTAVSGFSRGVGCGGATAPCWPSWPERPRPPTGGATRGLLRAPQASVCQSARCWRRVCPSISQSLDARPMLGGWAPGSWISRAADGMVGERDAGVGTGAVAGPRRRAGRAQGRVSLGR